MKKLLSVLFAGILLCSVFITAPTLIGSAAGGTVLAVSNKTPNVGESITITVTIKADESMYATEGYLSFDTSILQFEGGASASFVDGNVKLIGTPGGASSQAFSLTFKAIGAGQSTVSLGNVQYVGADKTDVAGSSFRLTVNGSAASEPTTPAAGSGASLTSLKISNGTLSPAFNPNVTSYKATVENSIAKTTLTATPASGAKVTGTGNIRLAVGDNVRKLTVTAADGKTKKVYTVTIHRLADGETVSTPETSDPAQGASDPSQENRDSLAVEVEGNAYRVSSDLSSLSVPAGFSASTSSFGGIPVPVYEDEKAEYTLFGLTSASDGTTDFYIYNAADNAFVKLKYAYVGNRFFIFPDPEKDTSAPEGFFEKKIEIAGVTVASYAYEDAAMTDFAVVYCYCEGKYGYYRYDSREETLQRNPDFKPLKTVKADADAVTRASGLGKLARLSARAKIVLLAIVVAAACVIALIVILIIHSVSERRAAENDLLDNGAFDYGIDDAVPFDTVDEVSPDDDTADGDQKTDDGQNSPK